MLTHLFSFFMLLSESPEIYRLFNMKWNEVKWNEVNENDSNRNGPHLIYAYSSRNHRPIHVQPMVYLAFQFFRKKNTQRVWGGKKTFISLFCSKYRGGIALAGEYGNFRGEFSVILCVCASKNDISCYLSTIDGNLNCMDISPNRTSLKWAIICRFFRLPPNFIVIAFYYWSFRNLFDRR